MIEKLDRQNLYLLITFSAALTGAVEGYYYVKEQIELGNLPDESAPGGGFAGLLAALTVTFVALKAADRLANKFYSSCSKNNTEKSS